MWAIARFVIDPPVLLRIVRDAMPVDPAHHLVAPNPVRSEAGSPRFGHPPTPGEEFRD